MLFEVPSEPSRSVSPERAAEGRRKHAPLVVPRRIRKTLKSDFTFTPSKVWRPPPVGRRPHKDYEEMLQGDQSRALRDMREHYHAEKRKSAG